MIFMDRHDVSSDVTAENVAELHQMDLKIQHKFNCKGLTYWFDGKRNTAFCLIEAPNIEAIKAMHDHAHGEIPNSIIEVNEAVVESFLGRIEDPEKSQNTGLNIINDPAFRTVMVASIGHETSDNENNGHFDNNYHEQSKSIIKAILKFDGVLVQQDFNSFLISFKSVTKAVLCAIEIKDRFQSTNTENDHCLTLNIGLSAGVPVTDKPGIFEDTIKMSEFLCEMAKGTIVMSTEVTSLYESENLNIAPTNDFIRFININEERLIKKIMDYMESHWRNSNLNVDNLSKDLGFSKSQLYRKLIEISGQSPVSFIKNYRLNQALKLLNKKSHTISEIAFENGFNSPGYFTKCFSERFGMAPSKYLQV